MMDAVVSTSWTRRAELSRFERRSAAGRALGKQELAASSLDARFEQLDGRPGRIEPGWPR